MNRAIFKSYTDSSGIVQGQFTMLNHNAGSDWYESFTVKNNSFETEEERYDRYLPTNPTNPGNPPSESGGSSGGSGSITPPIVRTIDASVVATDKLKSGYGITSKVTVTGTIPVSKVVATLPDRTTVQLVKSEEAWVFPANTGRAAAAYNLKHGTISRQVFVPVKFPDKTDYIIVYDVYDDTNKVVKTLRSYTYIDGNMYEDDYTVNSKTAR